MVPVTMGWHVFGLLMGKMASRCVRESRIYRISSRGQPTGGGSPPWGGRDGGLVIPRCKNLACYHMLHRALDLVQDRDQWRVLVNVVMNCRVL
jgi:hypothetical protein